MSVIEAIIFDMDDTLVSTADLWGRAERNFFKWLGIEFHLELAAEYKGMNSPDIGSFLFNRLKPTFTNHEECRKMMRTFLLQEFTEKVEEMEGATALLKRVSSKYKTALASGSPPQAIEGVLVSKEWQPHFDCVISSEDVPRGKPEPDVFLKAAESLGVKPEACLVIEDSLPGTQAAKKAGMPCFLVPSNPRARLHSEAHLFLESLNDIQLSDIHGVSELQGSLNRL